MTNAVKLSDLYSLPKQEREAVLDRLVEAAYEPPNGQIEELEARISDFELRYEVPSIRMLEELSRGQLKETADIASWLMLLRLRDNLAHPKPS